MDKEKIAQGVRLILEGIGEDPGRPGLKKTPERIGNLYEDILSGFSTPTEEILKPIEGESHDEMVILKDISFYSVCEHHLLPFFGKAHIAYIPNAGNIVGIGELAKALEILARRLQMQERLTTQLADLIMAKLEPKGTMVIIDAEHLCLSMRGIRKPGSRTVTSAVRGLFRNKSSTREEMLGLIKDK